MFLGSMYMPGGPERSNQSEPSIRGEADAASNRMDPNAVDPAHTLRDPLVESAINLDGKLEPRYPDVKLIITIDGPSGAGKSTLAKLIAQNLGLVYLESGAIYRALGLFAIRKGIDLNSVIRAEEAIRNLESGSFEGRLPVGKGQYLITALDDPYDHYNKLRNRIQDQVLTIIPEFHITFSPPPRDSADLSQSVYLNNEDVTKIIRTPEVSAWASVVAMLPKIREQLLPYQRTCASAVGCVTEGRDTGSTVFSAAEEEGTLVVHIYMDAPVEVRAKRRFIQNEGRDPNEEELKVAIAALAERDFRDSTRESSPLRKPADALTFDSSRLSQQEIDAFIEGEVDDRVKAYKTAKKID